jgi:hypothetical protein
VSCIGTYPVVAFSSPVEDILASIVTVQCLLVFPWRIGVCDKLDGRRTPWKWRKAKLFASLRNLSMQRPLSGKDLCNVGKNWETCRKIVWACAKTVRVYSARPLLRDNCGTRYSWQLDNLPNIKLTCSQSCGQNLSEPRMAAEEAIYHL